MKKLSNRYYPPMGSYRLVVPYPESFRHLQFDLNRGDVWVHTVDEFYSIDDIYLAENGEEKAVKAVKDTDLARKMYENRILTESNGFLIIRSYDEAL